MKKILFIEDEAALQRAMTQAVQEAGYAVFSALDGEIGIRLAEKEMPDLILCDLILPKKNGLEVIAALKKNPSTADIPIIVLSNLEDTQNIQKAMELGVHSYLVKTSYALDEVISKIRQATGE